MICTSAYLSQFDNFDFPPASNLVPTPVPHGLHRRDTYRPERIPRSNMEERPLSEAEEAIRRHRLRESTMREQFTRRQAARRSPVPGAPLLDPQAPPSAIRSRPHATPSDRYLRGHRYRPQLPSSTPEGAGAVQQAVERLNEASSNLSSLLDQPIPRIGSPDTRERAYSGESEVNRRRVKRRKLENDPLSEGFKAISYGYRGQVVPGPLKMEIVSCDGGLHADAARHGREYWPENVLRNDKSVYCTDSSKCNIIMRHQGETTFCLKKLVIKAPERGFTAPYDAVNPETSAVTIPANAVPQYPRRHDIRFYGFGRATHSYLTISHSRAVTTSCIFCNPRSTIFPSRRRHNPAERSSSSIRFEGACIPSKTKTNE